MKRGVIVHYRRQSPLRHPSTISGTPDTPPQWPGKLSSPVLRPVKNGDSPMMHLSKQEELPSGIGIVVGLCLSIPLWIAIIAAGYWIHRLMI